MMRTCVISLVFAYVMAQLEFMELCRGMLNASNFVVMCEFCWDEVRCVVARSVSCQQVLYGGHHAVVTAEM